VLQLPLALIVLSLFVLDIIYISLAKIIVFVVFYAYLVLIWLGLTLGFLIYGRKLVGSARHHITSLYFSIHSFLI
jgi:hypothetical protein